MEKGISLKRISEQRSSLMGLAIVFVMITHNTLCLSGVFELANNAVKVLTQSGVDIFFFVSGIGCFYSLNSRSVGDFYVRRIKKVLVPFLIVLLLYGIYRVIFDGKTVSEYLNTYSSVTFFTKGELAEWFIAAILATYLICPLLFLLLKSGTKRYFAFIVFTYVFIIVLRFVPGVSILNYVFREIWTTRMPAFMVGMYAGKKMSEEEVTVSRKSGLILMCVAFITALIVCALYYVKVPAYWLWIRFLLLPLLIGIFAFYFFFVKRGCRLDRALSWVGAITLEIYLVHEKILSILRKLLLNKFSSEIVLMIVVNILAFFLAIACAKGLQLLTDLLLKKKKVA